MLPESLNRAKTAMALFLFAAFLTLYWVLRGAPPGQASSPEGPKGASQKDRDRTALKSALGMILMMAAAFMGIAWSVPWSILALPSVLGGYWLLNQSIAQARLKRHDSLGMRHILHLSQGALTATLLGGVLVIGNAIAFRYADRPMDLTSSGIFSLSERSKTLIDSIDKPLTFTLFHGQDPRSVEQFSQLARLLNLYVQENREFVKLKQFGRFGWTEFDELAKKYPEIALTQAGSGGILLEYGEGDQFQHVVLNSLDLFGRDSGRTEGVNRYFEFNGEDAITSALNRLLEPEKPRIIVLTGHGEVSLEDTDQTAPSLSFLKSRLGTLGAQVGSLNLLNEDLSSQITLVIVAGPKTPYQPEEVKKLKSYMDQGGRVLFCLGGPMTPGVPGDAGLKSLLAEYRLDVGNQPVYDTQSNFRGNPAHLVAPVPRQTPHAVMAPLAGGGVMMPNSSAIEIQAAESTRLAIEPIVRSGARSWIETTSGPNEKPEATPGKDPIGPATLGVLVSEVDPKNPAEAKPRFALFSCPMVAENRSMIYNQHMVINVVSWLRGRNELLGIPPKSQAVLKLTDSPEVRTRLLVVPTIIAFSIIMGTGMALYMARRK